MRSSHETADRTLVRALTSEAPSAIHWLEALGVEFTRSNGGYRLAGAGCDRHRLLQVGDRTGHAITKALRQTFEAESGVELPHHALTELRSERTVGCDVRREGRAGRDRSGCDRARRGRTLLRRGGDARRASTNHPNATGEVTRIALDAGVRAATSTRSSTTPTAAPGRRRCRATRSRRRPARTAPSS